LPDYKTLLKKDLIKDLAVPAVENVTGPFDWKGPKNEEPEW
jgi:hypothetical protein